MDDKKSIPQKLRLRGLIDINSNSFSKWRYPKIQSYRKLQNRLRFLDGVVNFNSCIGISTPKSYIDITLPLQPFLNTDECIFLISALSMRELNDSFQYVQKMPVQAVVFFMNYFMVDCLKECIDNMILNSPSCLPDIIKVLLFCRGIKDKYLLELIDTLSDFIGWTTEMIYRAMNIKSGFLKHPGLILRKVRVNKVKKRLRDVLRVKKHQLGQLTFPCAYCGHTDYIPYDRLYNTIFLECCGAMLHRLHCRTKFFQASYNKSQVECMECKTKWSNGSPAVCDRYLRWLRYISSLKHQKKLMEHYYSNDEILERNKALKNEILTGLGTVIKVD